MSRLRRPIVGIAVAMLIAACWVDGAMEAVVGGQHYRGLGPDNFVVDRDSLTSVGSADSTPRGLKPETFRFPDISPSRVFVMYATDGTPILFVADGVLANVPAPSVEGSDPLAAVIPELCRYWRDPKPMECGTP